MANYNRWLDIGSTSAVEGLEVVVDTESGASSFGQHAGRSAARNDARQEVVYDRPLIHIASSQSFKRSKSSRSMKHQLREAGVLASRRGCMIDPRKSPLLAYWDGVSVTCLFFVALVTPFEIAYLSPPQSMLEPLFIINQVITVVFAIDFFLQFILMHEITTKSGDSSWVSDRWLVAKHYLKGWFFIDFVSILVSALDYLPFLLDAFAARDAMQQSQAGDVGDLKLLRVLRTLRLIRVVKVLTGSKIIRKYETQFAINYAMLSLVQCISLLLLISHWVSLRACLVRSGLVSSLNVWVLTSCARLHAHRERFHALSRHSLSALCVATLHACHLPTTSFDATSLRALGAFKRTLPSPSSTRGSEWTAPTAGRKQCSHRGCSAWRPHVSTRPPSIGQ